MTNFMYNARSALLALNIIYDGDREENLFLLNKTLIITEIIIMLSKYGVLYISTLI